jgi:ech hydrogenase subunit E
MNKTVVLMGPQHPVLIEPVVLDLVLEDEKIVDCVPSIGFVHRGLEQLVEKVEFTEFNLIAERVCGICSFMHGMGYCMAIEEIMGVQAPERARWLRLIWAELSRMQSHLLWLGLGADALGFENLFMTAWKLREGVLDLFDETTGGRLIHSVNKPGGIKRDISDAKLTEMVARLTAMEKSYGDIAKVFLDDKGIRHRLEGVGVLTRQRAHALGTVGPMARGSGLSNDVRLSGSALYDRLKFEPLLETEGDCHARARVRVREIPQSIDLIRQAVAQMPKGEGLPIEEKVRGFPKGECFLRLEQPRGEVVYYVKANGTKLLERFRARTPTFANLAAMIALLKGTELADAANILLTIDPCISCTER